VEVAASSSKDKLVPIYDKVKEGMKILMKAYENLKKKYPSEMSNPVSLENAKKYLDASITSFNNTLEELKKES
jgi:phosphopantothenate synthetase